MQASQRTNVVALSVHCAPPSELRTRRRTNFLVVMSLPMAGVMVESFLMGSCSQGSRFEDMVVGDHGPAVGRRPTGLGDPCCDRTGPSLRLEPWCVDLHHFDAYGGMRCHWHSVRAPWVRPPELPADSRWRYSCTSITCTACTTVARTSVVHMLYLSMRIIR